MTIEVLSPVGRIVWGHPLKAQTKKDQRTKQPVLKDGQPVDQWVFGIAFSKQDFQSVLWPAMAQEAATYFPSGTPSNFAWKYKDGDGVDANGKPFSNREGYAGCYVLTVSSEAFAPPVFKSENNAYRNLSAEEIKCGDYVAVKLSFKFNEAKSPNTPGLYVNPQGILHVGYGHEIITSGADPEELFAGANFALPAGATAVPQMGAAPLPAGMAAPQQAYQQQPMMQPQQMQPAPQQVYQQPVQQPLPAPAHDFVQNAGTPVQQQPMMQPQQMQPAPQQHVMPGQAPMTAPVGMPGMPVGR